MTFILSTSGNCCLEDEAGQAVPVPALSLVMLAYLYDIGRPVTRRELASLFWPGPREAAATNLRSTLRRLSRATSSNALVNSEGSSLSINSDILRCDLDLKSQSSPLERLQTAIHAVARQFLPSYGEGASALDIWVRDVRVRLAGNLRSEYLALRAQLTSDAARSELTRAAVLLLERDPHDDEVRRALVTDSDYTQGLGGIATSAPYRVSPHVAAAEADQQRPEFPAHHTPPRIALLPPETSHEAQRRGSIANALIEDLTIAMCASKSVSVVAPYTSERIRASKDKAAILAHHSVLYALDTRRSDDRLFVQLIYMPTDEIVWASRFQLDPLALSHGKASISDAIQRAIIDKINERRSIVSSFDQRPEPYFYYLKGLQALSTLNLPAVRKARRYFKNALDGEGSFAPALAGVSRTLTMEWLLTARNDLELLHHAERLARGAIDENRQLAGAFKELGVSQLYMGKIDESLQALGEAEAISPHYADVLYSHADTLVHASNPRSALAKIESAIALNPLSPDTYFWTAAGASYFLGDYRQALSYIGRMHDSNPASRLAAASWAMLGESAKARACRVRVMKNNPDFDLERWLKMIPHKERWQTELYREGLVKAGF